MAFKQDLESIINEANTTDLSYEETIYTLLQKEYDYRQGQNIIFSGNSGTGKTHILIYKVAKTQIIYPARILNDSKTLRL